jgi:hypothetical protein
MFVSQLGAVESFARTAAHELAGEAGAGGFVRLGGSRSGSQEIHYDLSQPLTQALVLHSALRDQGSVQPARTDLARGTFVEVVGEVYLPGLGAMPQLGHTRLDQTVAALEAECHRQQQVVRAFGDADTTLMLLIVKDDSRLSASVIDRKHVRAGAAGSYLAGALEAFGLMEGSISDVPLFTLIYMRPYV